MNNTELIAALRYCKDNPECYSEKAAQCPYDHKWTNSEDCQDLLLADAADALEADEKRIKELESQAAFFDAEKLNYQENIVYRDELIKELEAKMPKWTMLKDEMPKPHTSVLVSGIEAINNVRTYKVMVNDNGTLRPTDYAPSIMWDYWMPFESPNCGAKMKGANDEQIH